MKLAIKKFKALIAAVIAAILVFVLAHPAWLPLPETTRQSLMDLEKTHFLIERSGKITAAHFVALLMALCVIWLLFMLIKFLLLSIGKKGDRARTVTELLISTVRYLAVIAAVVWGLSILGVNTTAVLAGIGIIGLIIGFGAQSLIEDILTGAFIIFEGQYHIGDVIVLDDFRGIVRAVGVRTTTIEDPGGNLKIVNNSEIRKLQNRSRANSIAACEVSVAYDTDIPRMEAILAEAFPKMFADHRDIYLAPPRYLGVDELGDSGIKLKIIVDCAESKVFAAKRQLNRDVRILFSETGIEIPFPQVVVHKG